MVARPEHPELMLGGGGGGGMLKKVWSYTIQCFQLRKVVISPFLM